MNPICAHCNQQIQPNCEVSSSDLSLLRIKEKKTLLTGLVKSFIDSVERLEEAKINFDDKNSLGRFVFEKYFQYNFQGCIEKLKANLEIIERTNMKCVFIGRTSNGKSAVINALLGKDVLPSYMGSTTSCFIKIKGCDESKAYMIDENGQKRGLDFLHKADKTEDNCYNIDEMLQMFYPKDKCQLLSYDIELIDSPGFDYIEDNDKWIDKYCADSNLFVLVLDCLSVLSRSERRFLEKVKEKISKPNVIVLLNKWDLIDNEDEDIRNRFKKQHLMMIKTCFVDHLMIYKSQKEIEERIFFVSAHGKGLQDEDGVVFDRFKEKLIDELGINANKRKVKGNVDLVLRYSQESSDILDKIKLFADNELKEEGLRESLQKIIDEKIEEIGKEFNDLVTDMSLRLTEDIKIQMMKNISLNTLQNAASIESLKDEIENCCCEHILERCQQSLNATTIHEYLQLFAKFNDMVQCFGDIQEYLLEEFLENVERIFSDKECVEDDLSLSTISMVIQIKGFIKDFHRQNNPGWIKKIRNLTVPGILFLTSSKKSNEPLEELNKAEIIVSDCQTGEELDSKSTQDTKSMVDMLTSLRKKLKAIVTVNVKEKEKVADILESNLEMLMETHVEMTISEIEENVKKCVDKYLRDKLEILEMWKRQEVEI